jgi:glycosyltransferase 2 family protein
VNVKKAFLFALKLAVSALSLYLVFSKTEIGKVFSTLKGIGPLYFLVAALLYITAQFVSAVRWKLLLPEKFMLRRLFSLYMIGSFFSSFLPGVIGGDVVKAYYLNKDAKKISLTLASVFMDRYLGYASLMCLGAAAFPFSLRYLGHSVYKWAMPLICVSFIAGSLFFFGLRLGRRFAVVAEFYEYFSALKSRKDVIFKAVLLSLSIQVIGFSTVALLSRAMGEHIPLLLLYAFLPIVITIATLPISISGLGVREGSFVVLLGLIKVPPETATSLSLAWFFSSVLGSLPGLVAYLRHSGGSTEG